VLRVFFRHDRRLFGEISKLVFRMINKFYTKAAGRRIQSAAVIAYASAGDFARFNPHLHGIFLQGGFDREGQFVHVPSLDLAKLSHYFRSSMVAFFLKRSLLNERLAKNMLGWTRSGFSGPLGQHSCHFLQGARGPRAIHRASARVAEEDARRGARGERSLPVRI
jgi:hypothetical protein